MAGTGDMFHDARLEVSGESTKGTGEYVCVPGLAICREQDRRGMKTAMIDAGTDLARFVLTEWMTCAVDGISVARKVTRPVGQLRS